LHEPGEIEADQYPPLLPAIVAAHEWLLGTAELARVGRALRLTWFLLMIALTGCLYALAREYLPAILAFCVVLALIANIDTVFLSNLCFAELPFTLASVVCLYSLKRGGRFSGAISGTSAAASYLLRTLGFATLAVWVLDSLVRRNIRQALLRAAVSAVVMLSWTGWIARVEHSPVYTRPAYAYQRAPYLFYNVSYMRNMSYRDPFRPGLGKITLGERIRVALHRAPRLPYRLGASAVNEHFGYSAGLPRISWRYRGRVLTLIAGVLALLILLGMATLCFQDIRLPVFIGLTLAILSISSWPDQDWRYLNPCFHLP
jgi:hypothetical protein